MILDIVCNILLAILTTMNFIIVFRYLAPSSYWDYWFCKDKKQAEIDSKKDEKIDKIINEIKAIKSEQKVTNERIDNLEFTVGVIDDMMKL